MIYIHINYKYPLFVNNFSKSVTMMSSYCPEIPKTAQEFYSCTRSDNNILNCPSLYQRPMHASNYQLAQIPGK